MQTKYPVIPFHQFHSGGLEDRLFLFAADAKSIAAWAGIPKKGWRIRMLFQRWVTPGREKELKAFWERASHPDRKQGQTYILGPAAIVVAIQGEPQIENNEIHLNYTSPIDNLKTVDEKLQKLADLVYPIVIGRLEKKSKAIVEAFALDPLKCALPPIHHDYVMEFALQLTQIKKDPSWFRSNSKIEPDEVPSLITSMEALCRPAIVVDGQHRLYGAQSLPVDVMLPVVAIANANWQQQIYQFVVINEKAQKVAPDLLNDIFASSLTRSEQEKMRRDFARAKVDIEARIAGVVAGRDPHSPFYDMVLLRLDTDQPGTADAYISQNTIQNLIEGGRGARGWRKDDDFYAKYIAPTFPNRDDWENWTTGKWREYWFAFWSTVRDFYRPRAKAAKGATYEIWSNTEISNLTKGVGLKMFQRFFMEQMIQSVTNTQGALEVLKTVLEPKVAEEKINEKLREAAIPANMDDFCEQVEKFLEHVPVRFFTARWETSLDDQSGQDNLLHEMGEAYNRENWRARAKGVFLPEDSKPVEIQKPIKTPKPNTALVAIETAKPVKAAKTAKVVKKAK